MNDVIWIQTPDAYTPNILVIDGQVMEYDSTDKQHQAMKMLKNYLDNKYADSLSQLCSSYIRKFKLQNIPNNFKTYWDNKGFFMQGVYSEKDELGRNTTFMFWCKKNNINSIIQTFEKDSKLANYTPVAEFINEFKVLYKKLKLTNLFIITTVVLTISLLLMIIWKLAL